MLLTQHQPFKKLGITLYTHIPMSSPIIAEHHFIPYTSSDLTGHKVLVLAPHPDDESLGCGGSLIRHTQAGDLVKVLVLTNGARGDVTGQSARQAYIAARQAECRQACAGLGITDVDFWDCEDRELLLDQKAGPRLTAVLARWQPTLIYAPSPAEYHPDHRAAALLLQESLAQIDSGTDAGMEVLFYENNQPLAPNTLVDITGVMDLKLAAVRCYATQLRELPYDDVVQALNRFRSITLGSAVRYAEGFLRVPAALIRLKGLNLPALRQVQIQAFQPSTNEQQFDSVTDSVVENISDESLGDTWSTNPAAIETEGFPPAVPGLIITPDPLELLKHAAGTLALWQSHNPALEVICELPEARWYQREILYQALNRLNIQAISVCPASKGIGAGHLQVLRASLARCRPLAIMAPALSAESPEAARFTATLLNLLAETSFQGWFYGYGDPLAADVVVDVQALQPLKNDLLIPGGSSWSLDPETASACSSADDSQSFFHTETFQRHYIVARPTQLGERAVQEIVRDIEVQRRKFESGLLRARLEKCHQFNQQLEAERQQLQTARAQLQVTADRLQAELALVTRSLSWRLTKPLRQFKQGYGSYGSLVWQYLRRRWQSAGHPQPEKAAPLTAAEHTPSEVSEGEIVPYSWDANPPPDLWFAAAAEAQPPQPATVDGNNPDSPTFSVASEGPLFSIILPVFNTPERYLKACLVSVKAQTWPRWELCIADDASTHRHVRPILEAFQAAEPQRTRIIWRPINGHICAASNSALELARGDFLALLDHDDLLTPKALATMAATLQRYPQADMLYSDEDKVDDNGHCFEPYYKPDWAPEMFLGQMYTCHLGVYRRALVQHIGGFRAGCEGAQDYDLVLRLTELTSQVVHVPQILYHWRVNAASCAASSAAKPYAFEAGLKAVRDALERRGEGGWAEPVAGVAGVNLVRYACPAPCRISLIILTRDQAHLLDRCLASVVAHSQKSNYDVILVDNGSRQPDTFSVFDKWQQILADRLTILRQDEPFNYSRLNNIAARQARGDLLLLLNNDVEVLTPDWLQEMGGYARLPAIGAVGARLLYPDFTIQHAGIVLGITGRPDLPGVAGHSHKHQPYNARGYFSRLKMVSNYSAVTGACLMIRRKVYLEAGGLEERLTTAFGDVDLGIRLLATGYRNVVLPQVALLHHESKTRGYEDTPAKQARFAGEIEYMRQTWGPFLDRDPYYNPNLTLWHENFALKSQEELTEL